MVEGETINRLPAVESRHKGNPATVNCFDQANEHGGFFFHYAIDRRGESTEKHQGARGGKTIWGSIAGIAKNFGYTCDYILWGVSWVNLQMMMSDLPWYDYETKTDEVKVSAANEIDILKKFAKNG